MSVDYNSLKVVVLKELLSERGLSVIGKKSDLVLRLVQSDEYNGIEDARKVEEGEGMQINKTNFCYLSPENNNFLDKESMNTSNYLRGDLLIEGKEEMNAGNDIYSNQQISGAYNTININSNLINGNNITSLNNNNDRNLKENDMKKLQNSMDTTQTTEEEEKKKKNTVFDVQTDEEKKLLRAKRFGITTVMSEEEKKQKRAERFGLVNQTVVQNKNNKLAGVTVDKEEEEKRKQRALRFGFDSDSEKLKKRAEKFGIVTEEEKRKKREERFATNKI